MGRIAVFAQLARYNGWVNERLFEVCEGLGETARRRDVGLFFRSIHGTLNHLLLGDRVWLGRLTATPFAAASLADELYADFDELWRQRRLTDVALRGYVEALDEAAVDEVLRYRSLETGVERSYPIAVVLSHLFNHQTHHRGQISAAVGQLGGDYGSMDLIWMPVEESA